MSTQEIEDLGSEEWQKLYELYRLDCIAQQMDTSIKDFVIWLGER